jgi:hypothetical protein
VTKDPLQALPIFLGALAEVSTSYEKPYENPGENKDLR